MSDVTKIQWCDSTVNPIMGCGGCELFPPPDKVLSQIDVAVAATGVIVRSKAIFKELVDEVFTKSENPNSGHLKAVNTTNIWHLRERFAERIDKDHGRVAAAAAKEAITKEITCYAAILHHNKAANILDREGPRGVDKKTGLPKARKVHPGYAPIFEKVTRFPGRASETADLPDLLGRLDKCAPWKERLPRMIFVSDMGDAFSTQSDFSFLKSDLMPAIGSENGKRHLWLWLTKRPGRMAKFAKEIGGFPENVCAMTTLTGPDEESLKRLAELKTVDASVRGLSIEPLWNRIPPSKLNLAGIDWVILGGESGAGNLTRPFALEWVEELREHCRKKGVAFFLKQLGRNPEREGEIFKLKDPHGGDWDEWDEALRLREFPPAFHAYRRDEMKETPLPRKPKKEKNHGLVDPGVVRVTPEEKAEFMLLDKLVRKGFSAYMESGKALKEIHERKLWRAGKHATWESYCRDVAGMSKVHAHRLVLAADVATALAKALPVGYDLPKAESQVRPLLRLKEPEQRVEAWTASVEKSGGMPTANVVTAAVCEVLKPLKPQTNSAPRSERRAQLVRRLREVMSARGSWDEAEKLLNDLEALL